ncbi:MAG: COX15/CtaA family protein [Piscinibacter sp.]|nr:COX15/CtaA family protein [Piscinibacter sp.]
MDAAASLVDLTPLLRMALLGLVVAAGPLAWWWLRHRGTAPAQRLRGLTLLTLFLTFDLVLFGSFTRLTDSGLGCPDWPGCYGSASPLGAHAEIRAEQALRPTGPVTHAKAWVEMVHRYLATGVGVLITVLLLASWREHRRGSTPLSPGWATLSFAWVCAQGAFGALTVTLKLAPAIVTLHLLGGIGLLVLLAAQARQFVPAPLPLGDGLRRGAWAVALLLALQVALGGWVSTNYAVLACRDFPTCQGAWWPEMDFSHAFTLWRGLGQTAAGDFLPFPALTAIHMTHRLVALVVLAVLALLAWRLQATGAAGRRFAAGIAALALLQLATGLANVVLGWPLAAAVLHVGGAAALAVLLTFLLVRAAQGRERAPTHGALPLPQAS